VPTAVPEAPATVALPAESSVGLVPESVTVAAEVVIGIDAGVTGPAVLMGRVIVEDVVIVVKPVGQIST